MDRNESVFPGERESAQAKWQCEKTPEFFISKAAQRQRRQFQRTEILCFDMDKTRTIIATEMGIVLFLPTIYEMIQSREPEGRRKRVLLTAITG